MNIKIKKLYLLVLYMDSLANNLKRFVSEIDTKTYSTVRFSLYTIIILFSYMSSALLVEKIYKTPYTRTSSIEGTFKQSSDYFSNPFGILLFNGFFGLCYGFLKYEILNKHSQVNESENIPVKQILKLSSMQLTAWFLYSIAIIQSSYITVNMILCCKLLVVVIFAVFFSKSSGNFKVKKSQIYISAIICLGIIVFNLFSLKEPNQINKPLNWLSGGALAFMLLIDGYKPQVAAQIRQKYSPRPSYIYYQVSKYFFIIVAIIATASTQGWKLMVFIWEHDRLALDLMFHACFDVLGSIFIYRIIVMYQQHVVPMIVTVRKLLSALFSIYYFHHNISDMQYVGICIVFSAILLELYISYRENSQSFKQIQQYQEETHF